MSLAPVGLCLLAAVAALKVSGIPPTALAPALYGIDVKVTGLFRSILPFYGMALAWAAIFAWSATAWHRLIQFDGGAAVLFRMPPGIVLMYFGKAV